MEYPKADWPGRAFITWSGVRVIFDLAKQPYSRIVDVKVRCRKCSIPKYENLIDEEWYRVVVPSFLVRGGDGHKIIAQQHRNHEIGPRDIDQLLSYVERMSPLTNEIEGRIVFLNE